MNKPKSGDALDFEIDFYERVLQKKPDFVDALLPLAEAYTRKGLHEKGLIIDEQLAKLCPDDPEVHYNLACSYALTGQCDLAAESLDAAINLGYRDFKWMAQDPDLKNLRLHAEYKKIRAKVRELQVKAR